MFFAALNRSAYVIVVTGISSCYFFIYLELCDKTVGFHKQVMVVWQGIIDANVIICGPLISFLPSSEHRKFNESISRAGFPFSCQNVLLLLELQTRPRLTETASLISITLFSIYSQGRIFRAPFCRVTFPDFWLADQLNSLSFILPELARFVCFYSSQISWRGGMDYVPLTDPKNLTAFSQSTVPRCSLNSDRFVSKCILALFLSCFSVRVVNRSELLLTCLFLLFPLLNACSAIWMFIWSGPPDWQIASLILIYIAVLFKCFFKYWIRMRISISNSEVVSFVDIFFAACG